jgi:cytoskeletal protein RodZ
VVSLGEKLKTVREAKGLDYEQVSRETNIAIRYLEALEAEIFSSFPGEPYIIGFLRTYGTYLDLDVQELLSLYRALKIQEQPVPVEQLLKNPSPLPKIFLTVLIVLVICGALGSGIYFLITRPRPIHAPAPEKRAAAEYTMDGGSLERRFYPGDKILIPLGEGQYKLEVSNLGDVVTIRTPGGTIKLELGQSANLDIDGNGIADLQITAADFAKNSPGMGAQLRIEMSASPTELAGIPEVEMENAASFAASVEIFSSPNAHPFTLQSNFQGYCMFRWEVLFERDRRDRNERYFQKTDELSIQAQNGIRIWASNAQSAKLQVIGGGRTVPLELGGPGEVVVADIRWVRDEDNRYHLRLIRMETGST